MGDSRDVKVFISWSGDLAKAVAVALREWLPVMSDRFVPWASDVDIAAGQRGLTLIERELAETAFGVVVVTAANQHAPWLNFEAGALGRTIPGDAEHRVVPLLVDLSGPTQVTGPMSQFQAEVADEAGVRSLLRSLGGVADVPDAVLDSRFKAQWHELEAAITRAKSANQGGQPAQPPREPADVLDEILLHVRQLRSDAEASPATAAADLSASEAVLVLRRRKSERKLQALAMTRRSLEALAALHDLRLDSLDEDDGVYLAWVAPVSEYSETNALAFQKAATEVYPTIKVEWVPF